MSLSLTSSGFTASYKLSVRNATLLDSIGDIFRTFDANRDSCIDRFEFSTLLSILEPETWSDERVNALLTAIDFNQDGKIQLKELLRWLFQCSDEDRADFIDSTGLDFADVNRPITVEVKTLAGESVFGPEEIMGSTSVARFRRRIQNTLGGSVGCLCSQTDVESVQGYSQSVLRDSFMLGVYSDGTALNLIAIENAFCLLTQACIVELTKLGAMADFCGQTCIRLGRSERLSRDGGEQGGLGAGNRDNEFMLTADGRLLAKESYYFGNVERYDQCDRTWRYEIAEGSFTILDPATCQVEVSWRRWAERRGYDKNCNVPPNPETLRPWEERLQDEREDKPHHLVPSATGVPNVLNLARAWLQNSKRQHWEDPRDDPLAGLPMPGVTDDALYGLEMDVGNGPYWRHGCKPRGPFAEDRNQMTTPPPTSEIF